MRYGRVLSVRGFEIHHGRTASNDESYILEKRTDRVLGTIRRDQRVWGTYIHDLFGSDQFRRGWIDQMKRIKNKTSETAGRPVTMDEQFDQMAELFASNMDLRLINNWLGVMGN